MRPAEACWRHDRDCHGRVMPLWIALHWLPLLFHAATCRLCGEGPFIFGLPDDTPETLTWTLGHEATHTTLTRLEPGLGHWSDCRRGPT